MKKSMISKSKVYSGKECAFTLMELLISMSVVAILSAILISTINQKKVRGRAEDGVIFSNLKKAATAIEAYNYDEGQYPQTIDLTDNVLGNYVNKDWPKDFIYVYDSSISSADFAIVAHKASDNKCYKYIASRGHIMECECSDSIESVVSECVTDETEDKFAINYYDIDYETPLPYEEPVPEPEPLLSNCSSCTYNEECESSHCVDGKCCAVDCPVAGECQTGGGCSASCDQCEPIVESPDTYWNDNEYKCGANSRCVDGVCRTCEGVIMSDGCWGCAGQGGSVCWFIVPKIGMTCTNACADRGGCIQQKWKDPSPCSVCKALKPGETRCVWSGQPRSPYWRSSDGCHYQTVDQSCSTTRGIGDCWRLCVCEW